MSATIVGAVMPAGAALLLRRLLDGLTSADGTSRNRLVLVALAIAMAGALAVSLSTVGRYAGEVVQRRSGLVMAERLFERIARFPGLVYFEDPSFHDRLNLADQAVQIAPHAIPSTLQQLIQAIVIVVTFGGVVLTIWPPMALLLVVAVLPALLIQFTHASRLTRVTEAMVASIRKATLYRFLSTDIRGAKEMRLFGFGPLMHDRLSGLLREVARSILALERKNMTKQCGLSLLNALVAGVGIALVVQRASDGDLSVGDVALFIAAVAGVEGALSSTVVQVAETRHALDLFKHYLLVIDAPDDIRSGNREPPRLSEAITFDDVWFRYGPEHPWVLRGLTMTIPAGQTVGLVGTNGAGKSTVVKLLCRFYEPERGRIRWDGVDIGSVDAHALRGRLAVTFQDYATYDLTADENIGLGNVQKMEDLDEIRAAARLAAVDDTLARLPNGYKTILSRSFGDPGAEGVGVALSGGQWQRVAVARGLMRTNADVGILDEPSSGLDAAAEYRLHQVLRRWRRERTTIIISHRLSALRDADLIVVVGDGQVLEQGTHDALMAARGEYARLFDAQARPYQCSDRASTAPSRV